MKEPTITESLHASTLDPVPADESDLTDDQRRIADLMQALARAEEQAAERLTIIGRAAEQAQRLQGERDRRAEPFPEPPCAFGVTTPHECDHVLPPVSHSCIHGSGSAGHPCPCPVRGDHSSSYCVLPASPERAAPAGPRMETCIACGATCPFETGHRCAYFEGRACHVTFPSVAPAGPANPKCARCGELRSRHNAAGPVLMCPCYSTFSASNGDPSPASDPQPEPAALPRDQCEALDVLAEIAAAIPKEVPDTKPMYAVGISRPLTAGHMRAIAAYRPALPLQGARECQSPNFHTFDIDMHDCPCGHMYGDHDYEWGPDKQIKLLKCHGCAKPELAPTNTRQASDPVASREGAKDGTCAGEVSERAPAREVQEAGTFTPTPDQLREAHAARCSPDDPAPTAGAEGPTQAAMPTNTGGCEHGNRSDMFCTKCHAAAGAEEPPREAPRSSYQCCPASNQIFIPPYAQRSLDWACPVCERKVAVAWDGDNYRFSLHVAPPPVQARPPEDKS